MESEVAYPRGHEGDQHNVGLHSVIEGEGHDHHEKKSVLKKVKDKAKKVKDTLKGQGHGHGHDQDHDPDHDYRYEHNRDDDLDEESDDEDEAEVHGAPIYEFSEVRGGVPGSEGNKLQELNARGYRNEGAPGVCQAKDAETTSGDVHGQQGIQGQPWVELGSTDLEEDPHAPKDRPESFSPPNYQCKVADPTGADGEEAQIGPILCSFREMKVQDETESKTGHSVYTGSHDQFATESYTTNTSTSTNQPPPHQEASDGANQKQTNQSSYTEKLSSATSVIADKAASAKNVVASKLGYGTDTGTSTGGKPEGAVNGQDKGISVKDYLAEKLRPGDEDRALSEVISDALHKRKEENKNKNGETRPQGKVTESKAVVLRLGTSEESAGKFGIDPSNIKVDSGDLSPGRRAVERVKGAVSSWFGKGTSHSQAPPQGAEAEQVDTITGDRSPQETTKKQ